jgi:hypothetical protein
VDPAQEFGKLNGAESVAPAPMAVGRASNNVMAVWIIGKVSTSASDWLHPGSIGNRELPGMGFLHERSAVRL